MTEVTVRYPYGNTNSIGQLTGRTDLIIDVPFTVDVEQVSADPALNSAATSALSR